MRIQVNIKQGQEEPNSRHLESARIGQVENVTRRLVCFAPERNQIAPQWRNHTISLKQGETQEEFCWWSKTCLNWEWWGKSMLLLKHKLQLTQNYSFAQKWQWSVARPLCSWNIAAQFSSRTKKTALSRLGKEKWKNTAIVKSPELVGKHTENAPRGVTLDRVQNNLTWTDTGSNCQFCLYLSSLLGCANETSDLSSLASAHHPMLNLDLDDWRSSDDLEGQAVNQPDLPCKFYLGMQITSSCVDVEASLSTDYAVLHNHQFKWNGFWFSLVLVMNFFPRLFWSEEDSQMVQTVSSMPAHVLVRVLKGREFTQFSLYICGLHVCLKNFGTMQQVWSFPESQNNQQTLRQYQQLAIKPACKIIVFQREKCISIHKKQLTFYLKCSISAPCIFRTLNVCNSWGQVLTQGYLSIEEIFK